MTIKKTYGKAAASFAAVAVASTTMAGCFTTTPKGIEVDKDDDSTMSMPQSGDMEQSDQGQSLGKKKDTAKPSVKKDEKRTTATVLSDTEAAHLDAQGLRGGVISRAYTSEGTIVTVTREGNTLHITETPAGNGGRISADGGAIKATDQDKDKTKPMPDTGTATGTPAVSEGDGTGTGGDPAPIPGGDPTPVPDAGSGTGDTGGTGGTTPDTPAPTPGGGTETPTPTPEDPKPEQPEPEKKDDFTTEATHYMNALRAKIADKVNEARVAQGLAPLKISYDQTQSAQSWANTSAERGYFDQPSVQPPKETPAGVIPHRGEVISIKAGATPDSVTGTANDANAAAAYHMAALTGTDMKKAAIMDADATHMGIGVVMGKAKESGEYTVEVVVQTTSAAMLTNNGHTLDEASYGGVPTADVISAEDATGKYSARPNTSSKAAPSGGEETPAPSTGDTTGTQDQGTPSGGDTTGGEQDNPATPAPGADDTSGGAGDTTTGEDQGTSATGGDSSSAGNSADANQPPAGYMPPGIIGAGGDGWRSVSLGDSVRA